MHLNAAARATSPVEDRLARKFASSFHAEVERSWVEAWYCGETGTGYDLSKRAVNNFAPAIPRPGKREESYLGRS